MAMPGEAVKERMKQNLREAEAKTLRETDSDLGSWFQLFVVCRKPNKSTKPSLLLFLPFFPFGLNELSGFPLQPGSLKTLPFFPALKGEWGSCPWLGGQGEACQGLEDSDCFPLRRW